MATGRQVKIGRDIVLFVIGIGGIIWQTVVEHEDRPYLLALFALCVGLPAYLNGIGLNIGKKETS